MSGERFPRRVYRVGTEPDPRFSLANERTFLAWVRTSIALVTAGMAWAALGPADPPGARAATAALLIGLALVTTARAWSGWTTAEAALRQGRPLPGLRSGAVLAGGLVIVTVVALLVVVAA